MAPVSLGSPLPVEQRGISTHPVHTAPNTPRQKRLLDVAYLYLHRNDSEESRALYTTCIRQLLNNLDALLVEYARLEKLRDCSFTNARFGHTIEHEDDVDWETMRRKVKKKGLKIHEILQKTHPQYLTLKIVLDLVSFLNTAEEFCNGIVHLCGRKFIFPIALAAPLGEADNPASGSINHDGACDMLVDFCCPNQSKSRIPEENQSVLLLTQPAEPVQHCKATDVPGKPSSRYLPRYDNHRRYSQLSFITAAQVSHQPGCANHDTTAAPNSREETDPAATGETTFEATIQNSSQPQTLPREKLRHKSVPPRLINTIVRHASSAATATSSTSSCALLDQLLHAHSQQQAEGLRNTDDPPGRRAVCKLLMCMIAEPIVGTGPFDREWRKLMLERKQASMLMDEDEVSGDTGVNVLAMLVIMSLMGAEIGFGLASADHQTRLVAAPAEVSMQTTGPGNPTSRTIHSLAKQEDGEFAEPRTIDDPEQGTRIKNSHSSSLTKSKNVCPVCKRKGNPTMACHCASALLKNMGVFRHDATESHMKANRDTIGEPLATLMERSELSVVSPIELGLASSTPNDTGPWHSSDLTSISRRKTQQEVTRNHLVSSTRKTRSVKSTPLPHQGRYSVRGKVVRDAASATSQVLLVNAMSGSKKNPDASPIDEIYVADDSEPSRIAATSANITILGQISSHTPHDPDVPVLHSPFLEPGGLEGGFGSSSGTEITLSSLKPGGLEAYFTSDTEVKSTAKEIAATPRHPGACSMSGSTAPTAVPLKTKDVPGILNHTRPNKPLTSTAEQYSAEKGKSAVPSNELFFNRGTLVSMKSSAFGAGRKSNWMFARESQNEPTPYLALKNASMENGDRTREDRTLGSKKKVEEWISRPEMEALGHGYEDGMDNTISRLSDSSTGTDDLSMEWKSKSLDGDGERMELSEMMLDGGLGCRPTEVSTLSSRPVKASRYFSIMSSSSSLTDIHYLPVIKTPTLFKKFPVKKNARSWSINMALETKNGNEAINPETNANVPIPDLKRAVERDLPLDSAVVFTGSWGNRSDCQSCYDPEEMEDVYSIVMSTLTVENDGESSGVSTPLAVATQQRVENTVIDLGAHFYDAQNDALKSFLPSQVGQVQGGLLRGLVVDFGFIAEERGGDMLDKLEVGVEMERRDNGVGINGNICELETEFENGFVNAGLCESRLERRYSKRLGREKVLGPIGRR